ncbi:hypothetical protein D3C77_711380 [compost metagenome]
MMLPQDEIPEKIRTVAKDTVQAQEEIWDNIKGIFFRVDNLIQSATEKLCVLSENIKKLKQSKGE